MPVIRGITRASAATVGAVAAAAFAMAPAAQAGARTSFIGQFHKIRTAASTLPGNGDDAVNTLRLLQ